MMLSDAGTSVGDPVETTTAGETFGRPAGAMIGAVKGNIGYEVSENGTMPR
jgi:acyl transferase domain-containing protein